MISRATITNIEEASRIEEVVQDFVTLKKRGVNFIGLCPFHNEKTPSFTVSPTKSIYKCFGCGRAGNAVKFVMEHESFSFPEALRYLARKYGITIEEKEVNEEEKAEIDKQDSFYIINQFARDYFSKLLFEHEEGKSIGLTYLKERGFREDIIRKFNVGYSLNSKAAFTDTAIKSGYNKEYIEELGLAKQINGQLFDFFRGRVIFAIHNLSGKVVGFGGRILGDKQNAPKYLNSPESGIYNKSKLLYGAYHAKNAIRQKDECLLVEGYTDVLSLHQEGIEHVVASSGTSLTPDQVRLIRRYTTNITILYDGDPAGIKAAMRGLELVLEEDMTVRIVLLPEKEDPDSLIRKTGSNGFNEYIQNNKQDFILFKASILLKENSSDPSGKAKVIDEIVSSIALIPNAIKRSTYIKECSRLMDVGEQLLINETNRKIREKLKRHKIPTSEARKLEELQYEKPEDQVEKYTDYLAHEELDIIRLLVSCGDKPMSEEVTVSEFILNELNDTAFETKDYQQFLQTYRSKVEEGIVLTSDYFTNHPDQKLSRLVIDLISDNYELSKNWEKKHNIHVPDKMTNYKKEVKSAILRFKLGKIRRMTDENNSKVKTAKDEKTIEELQRTGVKLLQWKKQLAKELNTVIIG